MNKCRWIVVAGAAVVLLPSMLVAQTDTSLSPQPDQQSTMPATGPQPAAGPSSVRETLGAPGQTGQQMADKAFVRTATEDGIADVMLGRLAVEKGGLDVKTLAQKL